MAQLMPLPLTVTCFSKIQMVRYWLTRVVPDKGLLNGRVCVCVCVCVCLCVCALPLPVTFCFRCGREMLSVQAVP